MNLPIRYKTGNLPYGFNGSHKALFLSMIKRTQLYISDQDVVVGNTLPTAPTYDAGVNFYNGSLKVWRDSAGNYSPPTILVYDPASTYSVTLDGTFTRNSTLTIQDADGTAALLTDLYIPRPTVILDGTGGTMTVDGNASESFYGKLQQNTTMTVTVLGGQKMRVGLINHGTNYTVTWPGAIKWPGGTHPVQPVSSTNGDGLGIYIFRKINNVIYGTYKLTAAPPDGSGDTGGDPGGDYGGYGGDGGGGAGRKQIF